MQPAIHTIYTFYADTNSPRSGSGTSVWNCNRHKSTASACGFSDDANTETRQSRLSAAFGRERSSAGTLVSGSGARGMFPVSSILHVQKPLVRLGFQELRVHTIRFVFCSFNSLDGSPQCADDVSGHHGAPLALVRQLRCNAGDRAGPVRRQHSGRQSDLQQSLQQPVALEERISKSGGGGGSVAATSAGAAAAVRTGTGKCAPFLFTYSVKADRVRMSDLQDVPKFRVCAHLVCRCFSLLRVCSRPSSEGSQCAGEHVSLGTTGR